MKPLVLLGSLCAVLFLLHAGAASARADSTGTFKIGPETEIRIDDETAKVDDLKAGMRAFVTADPLQDGYAATITAQSGKSSAAAPKAEGKEKKAKPEKAKSEVEKVATITQVSSSSITVAYE